MAQNDMLKRYLDAGMAFTQLTRARAEAIVKDLVKAGELQREQTQERVDELLERSRKNTDQLRDLVRKEIRQQLSSIGLATKDDIARLERKLSAGGAKKAAPAKKATKAAKASGASKA
jgi:polyhydroxyalkanoate synthesis regulator phasin